MNRSRGAAFDDQIEGLAMFKVLLPAAAALGLVAAAARSQDAASEPRATPPVMTWTLHHDGEVAKLAYGVPHSDHLALMVACRPGDRLASVHGDVRLEAARVVRTGPGPQPLDPLSGDLIQEIRVALDDPSLIRLAERGRLTVAGDAGRFTLAAGPEDRRLVRDFLAYCGAERA